jgi:anti-sigma factor RsiW
VRCDRVRDRLSATAAGEATLDPEELLHVQRCLRCQAELAQHRRVQTSMRSIRRSAVEPGSGMLGSVLAGLEREPSPPRGRPAIAGLVGLAAAAVAGALGVAVIASRARRPLGAHGQLG